MQASVAQIEEHFDTARLVAGKTTSRQHKSAFGQYLTPSRIARFMASLFTQDSFEVCRLLDPGAGLGSLTGAFLERWQNGELPFMRVEATAFEIDERLRNDLCGTMTSYRDIGNFNCRVVGGDFIEKAVLSIQGYSAENFRFTHAILNPPYKKIGSDSLHRKLLRKAGIETVNLYSGFLGLTIRMMETHGQIVAIVPRSFCNGPYYRSFRDLLLDNTAIRHIHLFDSRSHAFKDDAVLQENVILLIEKNGKQADVTISTSKDGTFSDISYHRAPFDTIVHPGNTERFIHVPTSPGSSEIELSASISCSLDDIGVQVSTGPIVDFRVRDHLRAMPEQGSVPLLYPGHFVGQRLVWPQTNFKKPNSLMLHTQTEKAIYPSGFYTVVRRFSSKEESRRIVANTISPTDFNFSALGFENHLNVFHDHKTGLHHDLARGLCVFLNSTAVDTHFRRFNGHTQVNATDLRTMKYPSRSLLMQLGQWLKSHDTVTQTAIDRELRKIA
jgi:adenine-specific DNA-methyltransferase